MLRGTIIKNTGSWYVVRTDDGQLFDCKVKGNFRIKGIRSTNPVAVGDHVAIIPSEAGTALISEILDRRNYVIRRASNLSKQSHIIAANVDQAMLLVTIAHPTTNTTFIDRFLASTEAYRVPVTLVFNKTDLYSLAEQAQLKTLMDLYTSLGYPCYAISAQTPDTVVPLIDALKDKTTLLSGNSGVGKSTLLNVLIPDAMARTADISESHDTGMHTTTFSQMFTLPQGGEIIDTPGIKGFGTFDMEPEEVGHFFREIFQISADCRFSNCTHVNEPHCAVQQAVREGRIAMSRFESYLSMLDDKEEGKYRADKWE